MRLITPNNMGLYHAWVDNAAHDPDVSRFFGHYWSWHTSASDSTWSRSTFVSSCGRGCAELTFRRPIETELSVLVCQPVTELDTSRAVLAGMLVVTAARHIAMSSTPWVCTGCAETNVAAMRLNHKVFGTPYGREPAGAWDGLKREWVPKLLWKRSVVELVEKNSAFVRRILGSGRAST